MRCIIYTIFIQKSMVLMGYMTAKEATKNGYSLYVGFRNEELNIRVYCGGQAFRAVWEKKGVCRCRWIK